MIGFVVSLNLHRRHLDESQRAIVAAKIATLPHGGDRVSDQAAKLPVATQAEAAALLNVSERTVRSARRVIDEGAPELVQAVERGKVSVSAAADGAGRDAPAQRRPAQSRTRAAEVLMPAWRRTSDFDFPSAGSRTSLPRPTFCAFSSSALISPMRGMR